MSKRCFYGQFNPPVDQYLFERFFPTLRGGISLECGSYDGIAESSCYFFEKHRGWHGVNVEASPPIFPQLRRNRPNSTNIHAALSDKAGMGRFTHVISPIHGENFGNGSLTHQPGHRAELVKEGCSFVDYEVRMITYPELIAEAGITRLDLFVLDIEGHEAPVIESMRQGALLPSVLCVEHGHFGVEKMRQMLAGLPFRFDSSLHVNSYYVNTLNPPSRPGALARLWDRVRGD
jgi:FkbM family methyltransferase